MLMTCYAIILKQQKEKREHYEREIVLHSNFVAKVPLFNDL